MELTYTTECVQQPSVHSILVYTASVRSTLIYGQIYFGASGSMVPVPEVPWDPFESKIKIWKIYSINMITFEKALDTVVL